MMRRKILMIGLGVLSFICLILLKTNLAYAQSCSGQNIDPGESTTVTYSIPSHPNEQLVLRVHCPSGKTCPELPGGNRDYCSEFGPTDAFGNASGTIGPFSVEGTYKIEVWRKAAGVCSPFTQFINTPPPLCTSSFSVGEPTLPVPYELCQGDPDCLECMGNGNSWTAIGCIPTSDPQGFTAWLLSRAIGIAGGIAFLLMIFAGIQIITSAGDPKRLQAGTEMLTSAIIGLIIIIFSLFLLQLIGVQILRLPGFE